jgi:hypothetical protein
MTHCVLTGSFQITSRFDGVIKKLYYEAGDMAIVGKVEESISFSSLPFPKVSRHVHG